MEFFMAASIHLSRRMDFTNHNARSPNCPADSTFRRVNLKKSVEDR